MGTYGRNFEFRKPPVHGQRSGRHFLDETVNLPIGAPVKASGAADALGRTPVKKATAAQAPKKGTCGIAVYEHGPAAFAGDDPLLTTYSDKDYVPAGAAVQVVSGDAVKVVFRNTEDRTFLGTRDYAGRVIVAGLGATPTLAVGDFLSPGVGDDDSGYWAETGTAANAWLVVTAIDNARGEVEAEFVF